MTAIPSFADYKNQARAAGFDDLVERVWSANAVVPTHTHPFSARWHRSRSCKSEEKSATGNGGASILHGKYRVVLR